MAHYHNHHHHHHYLTIYLILVNLRCRCSVKFSLSERDGDSNRFLSSWRGIPNTNPASPHRSCIRSPLVQLRNQIYGARKHRTLRESTMPGTPDPLDSRYWLPAHPYYRQGAHFHFSVFRPELRYSASRSK